MLWRCAPLLWWDRAVDFGTGKKGRVLCFTVIYWLLNREKQTFHYREIESLLKIGLNFRTKLKFKLLKLVRNVDTDDEREKQAKQAILRMISSQVSVRHNFAYYLFFRVFTAAQCHPKSTSVSMSTTSSVSWWWMGTRLMRRRKGTKVASRARNTENRIASLITRSVSPHTVCARRCPSCRVPVLSAAIHWASRARQCRLRWRRTRGRRSCRARWSILMWVKTKNH